MVAEKERIYLSGTQEIRNFQLPDSDVFNFAIVPVNQTAGFRRLHFGAIRTTESGILYPPTEASKTGSW
jgi:hypothetical protein